MEIPYHIYANSISDQSTSRTGFIQKDSCELELKYPKGKKYEISKKLLNLLGSNIKNNLDLIDPYNYMNDFINLINGNEIEINENNGIFLFCIAKHLEIQALVAECEKFVKNPIINDGNFFYYLKNYQPHQNQALKEIDLFTSIDNYFSEYKKEKNIGGEEKRRRRDLCELLKDLKPPTLELIIESIQSMPTKILKGEDEIFSICLNNFYIHHDPSIFFSVHPEELSSMDNFNNYLRSMINENSIEIAWRQKVIPIFELNLKLRFSVHYKNWKYFPHKNKDDDSGLFDYIDKHREEFGLDPDSNIFTTQIPVDRPGEENDQKPLIYLNGGGGKALQLVNLFNKNNLYWDNYDKDTNNYGEKILTIRFLRHYFRLEGYFLSSRSEKDKINQKSPKSWILRGKKDNESPIILDERKDVIQMNSNKRSKVFVEISGKQNICNEFQFEMINNFVGSDEFSLTRIEFFGTLYEPDEEVHNEETNEPNEEVQGELKPLSDYLIDLAQKRSEGSFFETLIIMSCVFEGMCKYITNVNKSKTLSPDRIFLGPNYEVFFTKTPAYRIQDCNENLPVMELFCHPNDILNDQFTTKSLQCSFGSFLFFLWLPYEKGKLEYTLDSLEGNGIIKEGEPRKTENPHFPTETEKYLQYDYSIGSPIKKHYKVCYNLNNIHEAPEFVKYIISKCWEEDTYNVDYNSLVSSMDYIRNLLQVQTNTELKEKLKYKSQDYIERIEKFKEIAFNDYIVDPKANGNDSDDEG